ncbi:MAG: response regulator transcription factor [Pseudomonadota bacterium]
MSQESFPTVIVGANPLLRESLSRFLQKSSFNVAALASCVDELSCEALPRDRAILLIIDGCDHPGDACGQIERFRQDHAQGRVVVLANHCAPGEIAQVLRSGANGYFATIATCDDFIKSLELVMGGQTVLPSEALDSVISCQTANETGTSTRPDAVSTEMPVSVADMPRFSTRELYILRCLTEGSSNKVIARECDIAEGTVKVHVKAIMRKTKVQNRTQAAIWALNNRALVWPASDDPSRDPVAELPIIKIALGTGTDNTIPAEAAEQVDQDISLQAHSIRRVAGSDMTSKAC